MVRCCCNYLYLSLVSVSILVCVSISTSISLSLSLSFSFLSLMSAAGVEAVAHALAGSTGGIFAMTLLYPLENIRTRLQVQGMTTSEKQKHRENSSNTSRYLIHVIHVVSFKDCRLLSDLCLDCAGG